MTGSCETIKLPGEVNKIKASTTAKDSGIEYKIYGQLNQKYGVIEDTYSDWHFTDQNPLIGLYGRESAHGIEELGFITLNAECQSHVIEQQTLSTILQSTNEMTQLNSKSQTSMNIQHKKVLHTRVEHEFKVTTPAEDKEAELYERIHK